MTCKFCKSIYHEFEIYLDICDNCAEAMRIMFDNGSPESKLKELIDCGWECITPGDKMRERNAKEDEIKYLKATIQELTCEMGVLRARSDYK